MVFVPQPVCKNINKIKIMKNIEKQGVHFPILHKIFFCERTDNIEMYMQHHLADIFFKTRRFEEMAYCRIPKNNALVKTIEKYYNHLIMR